MLEQPPTDEILNSTATKSLKDFRVFQATFATLNTGFNTDVQTDQITARKMRRLDIDVESLRQSGDLEAHETFIPVRIIDNNIKQKLPTKMAYLKSANRLAIFEPKVTIPGQPPPDTARVESEFWRVMTYPGWEVPFIQCMDGAEFVGFDWFEVLYTPEENRPGHVSVNHVGRANLLFDLSVSTIQDSKLVAKRIPLTLVSLTKIAREFGFKEEDILKLREKIALAKTSATADYDESIAYNEFTQDTCIFRVFFKEGGVVWTSWYAQDIDHYLTPPTKFYNGVDRKEVTQTLQPGTLIPVPQETWVPEEEENYPYYPLLRTITEDKRIARTMGAVSSDYPIQEAACTIYSCLVNQTEQSAQVMASPATDDYDRSGAPKQLSLKIQRGQIWDRKMDFFHPPPPDPAVSRAVQELQQLNATQNNQIAWAVQNREDSRKTATEVQASEKQQSQINSTETLMMSICFVPLYTAAWRIVQAQALRQLIVFCPTAQGANDVALISLDYNIKAAGDTDYVEKQQTIINMQQDWPIVVNTPAAMPFLSDYLRLRYPNKANTYIEAIQMGQQNNEQLIAQLKALLKEAVTDETGNLTAEFQPFADRIYQLIGTEESAGQAPNAVAGGSQPVAA